MLRNMDTQLDGNFMSTINNHTIIDAGIRTGPMYYKWGTVITALLRYQYVNNALVPFSYAE